MTGYAFGPQSEGLLQVLHPDLLRVVRRAMGYQAMDLTVLCTTRTAEAEAAAVAAGNSATLHSKHFPDAAGFAHAVDLAPASPVDFKDVKRFGVLMGLMCAAAKEEGVQMRCGGNWNGDNNFHDNTPEDPGHFELA